MAMFNPCYPFTTALFQAMLSKGIIYYVRSTFVRGLTSDMKMKSNSFLISHYHDAAAAERHYQVIAKDPFRFLYDIRNPIHLKKLSLAASQPAGYHIYSTLLKPGIEKEISLKYREHTKRYLEKHTHWDLKGRLHLTPLLYFQLGVLYASIHFRGGHIKLTFEDIENA